MRGVNQFLSASRAAALSIAKAKSPGRGCTVVLCNESADLDSVVCAIVKAYDVSLRVNEAGRAVIPLINIPKADLVLRTETTYWLKELDVDAENLVFSDELDLNMAMKAPESRLIVVDHNELPREFANPTTESRVLEIVDHHKDEGKYGLFCKRRVIEMVGSAATLVAEDLLASGASNKSAPILDEVVAQLIVGAILVDTGNFDPATKKGTPKDVSVVSRLEAYLPDGFSADKAFEGLKAAKYDQNNLSTLDLLRRDYKQWDMGSTRVGIASVGLPIHGLLELTPSYDRPSVPNEVRGGAAKVCPAFEEYCTAKKLDVLLVMFSYFEKGDEFTRQMAIYLPRSMLSTPKEAVVCKAMNALEESPELFLSPLPVGGVCGDYDNLTWYSQGNVKSSRKQVQPILAKLFGAGGTM